MKIIWKGSYKFTEGFKITLHPNVPEEIDDEIAKRIYNDYGDEFVELVEDIKVGKKDEKENDGFHECDVKGCNFKFDTPQGLSSHKRSTHKKKKDTKKKK